MEATMVDAKIRYAVFILSIFLAFCLPGGAILRVPFVYFGLGGIRSELQLSRDRDRETLLKELQESARKAQHERVLELLREIERQIGKDLPSDSEDTIM
jgi:hypothetical protein